MPLLHKSQYSGKNIKPGKKNKYHGPGSINIKLEESKECLQCQIFNDNSFSNNPFINNQYNIIPNK